jgi:hypothetical protein
LLRVRLRLYWRWLGIVRHSAVSTLPFRYFAMKELFMHCINLSATPVVPSGEDFAFIVLNAPVAHGVTTSFIRALQLLGSRE